MSPTSQLRVSLVQQAPVLGDLAANLKRVCAQIRAERAEGAQLVVFPELALSGYFLKDLTPETALTLEGPELRELVAATGADAALVGTVLESPRFTFHNAALLISDGEVRHIHRKVYLPTYGIFDEQRHLAPGDSFQVVELALAGRARWRVGVLICEDLWHPSSPYLLSLQGADLILCPSASPGRGVAGAEAELGSAASYSAMLRTYAELFTVFVAYCNRVGFEDGFHFWGGSRVLSPDGSLVAGPGGDGEESLRVVLDRRHLRRARIAYPLLRDERVNLVRRQLGPPGDG
ncbi:MAG: nitrilase-related carbon-nitrogen hydrolase [Candidatus Dormibacteria bacterium]